MIGAEQLVEALDRIAAPSADTADVRGGRVMSETQALAARAGAVRARRDGHAALGAAGRDGLDWFLLLTAFVGVNQWLYVRRRRVPGVDRAAPRVPAALGDLRERGQVPL